MFILMFGYLSCLIDAVNAIDSPDSRSATAPEPRQERLVSVSSVVSLCSLAPPSPPQSSSPPPISLSHSLYPMPRTKVPRKRISTEQTATLQMLFDTGVHFPTREIRERLARQLNLKTRTIQVWFQNRRQAARNRARGVERPPSGQKLAIRWMKPVVFCVPSSQNYENINYGEKHGSSIQTNERPFWNTARRETDESVWQSTISPSTKLLPPTKQINQEYQQDTVVASVESVKRT